jgi:hypothetical protein
MILPSLISWLVTNERFDDDLGFSAFAPKTEMRMIKIKFKNFFSL